jgi:hypothetical protein
MREIEWDGGTITKPGVYKGIPLETYHNRRDLFDGPSVSKSSLKWILPTHGGSPKAFWGRWKFNPDHVEPKSTEALNFGRAAHCLLLGDEDFRSSFAVEPETYTDDKGIEKKWSNNATVCREWHAEQAASRRTVIKAEQLERIRLMAADAAKYPLVQQGILNGRVERTLCWKDPATGIWMKARPDAMPEADGVFADLKTASSLSEDFLERQNHDAIYFIQAAMSRMICRALKIPFETFVLIYVLNNEVPDTAHVELDAFDLDRGEHLVRHALDTIKSCLDSGEWPGARPFNDGTSMLKLKQWSAERIDRFLEERKSTEGEAA